MMYHVCDCPEKKKIHYHLPFEQILSKKSLYSNFYVQNGVILLLEHKRKTLFSISVKIQIRNTAHKFNIGLKVTVG